MGKLAVVFFAVLAFQAAFGGVTRRFGDDREELRDLLHQVVRASENILGNTWEERDVSLKTRDLPWDNCDATWKNQGITWDTHDFVQDIEDIIRRLEDMTEMYNGEIIHVMRKMIRDLQEICKYSHELKMNTKLNIINKLERVVKMVINHLEDCVRICDEETRDGNLNKDIKKILKMFMHALEKLHKRSSIHKNMLKTGLSKHTDNDIHTEVKNLEMLLERVHFKGDLMSRCFVHLIREYLDNLKEYITPELRQYHTFFFKNEKKMWSIEEIKSNLWGFIRMFMRDMDRMPEVARVAFCKATCKFHDRMEIMVEVNTPIREVVFHMHTISSYLTSGLENVPEHVDVHKMGIEFVRTLERLENLDSVINIKRIMHHVQGGNWNKHALILAIRDATTHMHMWIITLPEDRKHIAMEVATEFLDILKVQKRMFVEMCRTIRDPDFWALHLAAKTNKMSMHFHGEVSPEDKRVLFGSLKEILEILERRGVPKMVQVAHKMKKAIDEFENGKYSVVTLLQRIEWELMDIIWEMCVDSSTLPREVIEIVDLYLAALDDIYTRHKINKGLLMVQSPMELLIKTELIGTRASKLLNLMVLGFKHTEMLHRGHRLHQMLEIIMKRLHKIGTNDLVKDAYERLLKIKHNLNNDLHRREKHIAVKLAIYIQEIVIEMKKLAFEQRLEEVGEYVKMYGDLLFLMKGLLNQIQYDLQVVTERYSVKTWTMQTGFVYERLVDLLQRVELKPELKDMMVTQAGVLGQFIKYWPIVLKKQTRMEDLHGKYVEMYKELLHVYRNGWTRSIEDLCELLRKHIRTIVIDLDRISRHDIQGDSEVYDLYKYTTMVLSKIMVRLENVHYYEYYHRLINNQDFVGRIHQISSMIEDKLHRITTDNEVVLYDLGVQTLKYIHRLEKVAGLLQVQAKVYPESFYKYFSEVLQVRMSSKINVDQVRSFLAKRIRSVAGLLTNILEHESHVGTKNALIRYMVSIEKLYVRIENIMRRNGEATLYQKIMHTDIHARYLLKAVGYVSVRNPEAHKVLQTIHQRLSKICMELTNNRMDHGHHNDVTDLKLEIVVLIKRISMHLWELCCSSSDHTELKSLVHDYLIMLQRMHIELETSVLTPQKWHYLLKWNFLKSDMRDVNTHMRSNYDGGFVKTFNGKHFQGTISKNFDYGRDSGVFKKDFVGEYKPEFGFRGLFKKTVEGRFKRDVYGQMKDVYKTMKIEKYEH